MKGVAVKLVVSYLLGAGINRPSYSLPTETYVIPAGNWSPGLLMIAIQYLAVHGIVNSVIYLLVISTTSYT